MKAEYINPFLTSAIAAFDTMLGCKLERGIPYIKNGREPEHDVSGVIGLSGKARGTIVLSLSRQAALNATAVLLQEQPVEINADVADAVGELTNIIAGGAKAKLEHLNMSVSLPTVITGKCHCVELPKSVTSICIPFESDWGRITVEVGLVEGPTDTDDATEDH